MRKIVLDIETKNIFQDVGKNDPTLLDISLVGLYDSAHDSYEGFLEEDFPRLWPILEQADVLIGFNSDHFDIPIINKYYPGDLSKIKSIDLMKEVRKTLGRRISLNALAEATLGVKKGGHGLDAVRWWKEGAIEKIRDYCLMDVRLTKDLYDYARAHSVLKYHDFGTVREISLDTTAWETDDGASMTHTFPF